MGWFFVWCSEKLFALSDRLHDWAVAAGRRGISEEMLRREDELFDKMMKEKFPEWRSKRP